MATVSITEPDLAAIKVLKENKTYRLADVILRKGVRWREDRQAILNDGQYNGTILYQYLSRMRHENDVEMLRRVTYEYIRTNRVEQPREDELVVQLRLGDVMDDYDKRTYESYLSLYKNLASKTPLKRLPVSRATIVTAMHFGANEKNGKYFFTEKAKARSLVIAELVTRQLVQRKLAVRIFSHENIDLDFCYMVGSRYFVKGQSKLSELVVRCMSPAAQHFELRHNWLRRLAG